ncbi:hypothetical protein [Eubacterium sp. 1001713B170207_170306_E7]|uniref:hypothetical protein n=1 Tax=Eubacterium sp. 1001713B170207_170306_E7 TaxID=2787097 RepID=UPI001899321C|nr:hypothetical protein [Eubacterium sp. 1001713B170207_170306_E7]
MTKEKRTMNLCRILLFTFALLLLCLQMPVAAATPEEETPVAEAVTEIAFQSTNANPMICKQGDKLNLSYKIAPETLVKAVKIGGQEVLPVENPEATGAFSAEYSIDETIKVEKINYEIQCVVTQNGQEKEVIYSNEEKDSIQYYKPIEITEIKYDSDNQERQSAIIGSVLTFSFLSNEELVDLTAIKIGDTSIELKHEVVDGKHYYSAQYTVPQDKYEDGVEIPLDLASLQSVKDTAGNIASVTTDAKIVYHVPLSIQDVHFISNHPEKGMAVKGSELTFSFSSNRQLVNLGQIRIGKNTLEINETEQDGKVSYDCHLTVMENMFSDLSDIPLDLSQLSTVADQYGNTATVQTNDTIVYYAPLEVSHVTFESDHNNPSVAINGSTLRFSFSSNHELINLDKIMIGNSEVALEMEKEGDHFRYYAKHKVNEEYQDASPITLDYSKIETVKDAASQDAGIQTEDIITYYKALSMNNIIKLDFACTGNKVGNTYYVKNNDQITVSFECNRPLTDADLRIGDQRIEMQSEDGLLWTATYTVQNLQDRSVINTTLVLQDIYETPAYHVSGDHFTSCIFYSALQINNLSYQSNNENGVALAKNGDVLTLSFSTNHESNIKNCQIGGQSVEVESGNRIDYTARIEVSGDLAADQEILPFAITAGDDANNEDVTKTQQDSTQIIYYAPIQLSDLKFVSSNERDGSQYAKDGDTLKASVVANHRVTCTGQIAGSNVTAAENDRTYTATQTVQGLIDQQAIDFSLMASDVAGNTPVTVTEGDAGIQIVYYAPITAEAAITSNNAKNSKYAKAGDTLSGVITANHEISTTDAQLHGFRVNAGGKGSTLQVSLQLEGGSQGNIGGYFSVEDVAGNTQTIEKQSDIIYDDIAPTIKIDPIVNGFMNQKISINALYEDVNLDGNTAEFKVNDQDRLQQKNSGQNTLASTVELSEDGTYSISAQIEDMAGNRSDSTGGTVVIDRTKPEIVTMSIDLDKQPAYKSGVKLSDYFLVKDDHLDTINCLLTNKTGLMKTVSWNLDDRIDTEGEKGMQLSALDKAKNQSNQLEYGFFVDGTAPKPIVTEKNTNTPIVENKKTELSKDARINIELDKIWIGNEKPDYFTKMEIKNMDSGEVINLLENQDQITKTLYQLHDDGDYQLTVAANDEVENVLNEVTYKMTVNSEKVSVTAPESMVNPLIYIGIAACAALCTILIFFLINKRKGSKTDENNHRG